MSKVLRVGIASYGLSGQVFHGPFLKRHQGFEVVSIVERTKELSKKDFPEAKIVKEYKELIEDASIDLIVVNTPTQLHYAMALEALEAGKHVILEKPFAVHLWEAEKLVNTAKDKNLTLAVYHNRRLESGFKTLKQIIDSKKLGEIEYFKVHFNRDRAAISHKKWKEDTSKGAGIFYDLAPHLLDQVVTLFGLPEKITSKFEKQRPNTIAVDYFLVKFYYPSGLEVEIEAGMYVRKPEPKFLAKGTNGTYMKKEEDHQEDLLKQGTYPAVIDPDFGILIDNNGTEQVIENVEGCYLDFYENVYQAITEKKPLLIKPEEALKIMELMEDIINSN